MDQAGSGVQAAARARILSSSSLMAQADNPVTGFMWFYYINTKVAPLTNVHCRMAIEYAANKTNLQTAYGGPYGGNIASTAIPPTVVGYSKFDLYNALSTPGGDAAAAKQQLQLCGQPNGFNVNIAYRSDRSREVASSQALQASLATVGIKATLDGFTAANYYGTFAGVPNYVHTHQIGLMAGGWGPDWPDAYGWGWALFDGASIVPAGNTNIAEENNPVVNNLFKQLEAATSNSARVSISQQIDLQVMKDAVMLPATYNKALLYRAPNLTNVYVQPYYGMYDYGTLGIKSQPRRRRHTKVGDGAGARPAGRAPAPGAVISFIIRRLIAAVFLLVIVSMVIFAIFFLLPKLGGQTNYGLATQYVGRNPTRAAVLQMEAQLAWTSRFTCSTGTTCGRSWPASITGPA